MLGVPVHTEMGTQALLPLFFFGALAQATVQMGDPYAIGLSKMQEMTLALSGKLHGGELKPLHPSSACHPRQSTSNEAAPFRMCWSSSCPLISLLPACRGRRSDMHSFSRVMMAEALLCYFRQPLASACPGSMCCSSL